MMVRYDAKTVIELEINGEKRCVTVRPSDVLLDVLRDQLGLTGAKPGCKNGDCGACTVVMDGPRKVLPRACGRGCRAPDTDRRGLGRGLSDTGAFVATAPSSVATARPDF